MAKRDLEIETMELEGTPRKKGGLWRVFWIPAAILLALSAGGLTGIFLSYYLNNSRAAQEVASLATYRPSTVTKIYADDGKTVIAELSLEKRIPLKEKDIPKNVENAILAVEDFRFYSHIGIDPYRIAGAIYKNITEGSKEGASTLTQQISKNLFLTREQTYTRKINEWFVALQIERFYTKRQILEMYVNHLSLGAGSYGIEAGAQTYFNKSASELTLEEAALLAAIPKAPGEYSPITNPDKAKKRRNIVLDQMAKYSYISPSEAETAKAKDIVLADTAYYFSQPKSSVADYPVEEVRKYLEDKYTTRVAQGGLQVYTTINIEAQKLATQAVRTHLRSYDRTKAWRSDYQSISNNPDGGVTSKQLDSYKHPDWYADEYEKGTYIKGLVMSVDAAKNEAVVRFGNYKAIVTAKEMGRSRKTPRDEFRPGLLPEFEVLDVDDQNQTLKVQLSQVPEVQAAIVSINAKTGEIVAMVGGYDFYTNRFNNATQGLRQTGSAYKPYIYTAAVEWGMTPEMTVSGAPIRRGGWTPHNYDGSLSHGNVPMKTALAKSYNIAAVHLLDQVGLQTGAQMVRRFGITEPMKPILPSALGATEASLLEMTSAYSVFPNKGIRVQPHLIRKVLDRDGNVLEQWEKTTYKVTSEYVAGTMVDMMRGVTQGGGTASGASAGGHPLAGKTGTVNDHTDVWFIGYTPTYVTGIWMGNPTKKTDLGSNMTGGHGAVPYFNSFMIPFMKDKPRDSFDKTPPMPPEIKELTEQRKREELEKLEKADEEGRRVASSTPGAKIYTGGTTRRKNGSVTTSSSSSNSSTTTTTTTDNANTTTTTTEPKTGTETPKTTTDKPNPEPKKTEQPTVRKPETNNEPRPKVTEPPKKKGKKGDDDPDR
jgi:penicillin-binding protein 1A